MLATAAGRKHDKINLKGTQESDGPKRISTIESNLSAAQTYAPSVEGAAYFGFQGKEDPNEGGDRGFGGGRGGRERRERQERPARGGRGAGGRKGGKIVVDDNDFPTL